MPQFRAQSITSFTTLLTSSSLFRHPVRACKFKSKASPDACPLGGPESYRKMRVNAIDITNYPPKNDKDSASTAQKILTLEAYVR